MSEPNLSLSSVEIETTRLILRAADFADASTIAELANDAAVAPMTARMPYPYSLSDAEAFILAQRDNRWNGTELALAIEDKAEGRFLGVVGLVFSPTEPAAEIGYWVGRAYWGNGIATEAARALIDHGFETRRIEAINGSCRVINDASRRVMEKCGLRYTASGLAPAPARGGAMPVDRFRLSRRDWESFKSWRPAIVRGGDDALGPELAC